MLNHLSQPPLSAGGGCSRETEEMVHGREQKTSGVKGKLLNRPQASAPSLQAVKSICSASERPFGQKHVSLVFHSPSHSQERNEGALR